MKRAIAIAGLALATLAGTGCQAEYRTPDGTRVVIVSDDESGVIDVSPPDRLDVIGIDTDTCDNYGGHLVGIVCEGVDY